ncbi:MAG: CRISPR-associated helicase Cas3' [Planctomycetia bacterium]|nr:CRISPR-associated helicase Cas3' [Planctomycetia bacterium]
MEYRAKSNPPETIQEHTESLLRCLEYFLSMYGDFFTENEKELLRLACETHDLGKVHPIFQEIVRGDRRRLEEYVPHGFFSGMFLNLADLKEKFSQEEVRALVTAIHYHHTRPDDYTDEIYRNHGEKYMKSAIEGYTGIPLERISTRYLRSRLFINSESQHLVNPSPSVWQKFILLKGLLNKMDYAASAHVSPEKVEIAAAGSLVTTIQKTFGKHLRPAQHFMAEHRQENVVVIAPTGSGKTEGALLWLDDHKGFYTLPMKVSANAIFKRICDKYDFKTTGLLHSDSVYEYLLRANEDNAETEESANDVLAKYSAVRSLAMPLTVSTVDQLFKFVFKALGTEIFAATLKYSRVIIDEMQMYDSKILAMLLCGLKTISDMGGKFAIITATLPPMIERILKEELDISFVAEAFPSDQRRHFVHLQPGDFDFDAIREAGKSKKVLVLCNTVKKAQEILAQLPGARLLHGRFIKRDRAILENEIQEFAHGTAPGIWISTQLVEASLDIDFDELHTEMCPVDSLLQRMGRCFRARNYDGTTPNVFVYPNERPKFYDEDLYKRSLDLLAKYTDRIFTEVEKIAYMNEVYDEEFIRGSAYYQTLMDSLQSFANLPPLKYDKAEADDLFRDIRNRTVIPIEIYEANRDEIDQAVLCSQQKKLSYHERLTNRQSVEEYTVSIQWNSKDMRFVDRRLPDTDIWLTRARYEFDSETHVGCGLLREKAPEPSNFL